MVGKILILNVGSSSIKYSIFQNKNKIEEKVIERVTNYEKEIRKILKNIGKLDAIGHRVVHGGNLRKTTLINKNVLAKLKKYSEFAPLHNISEIKAIEICTKLMPIKQYAIFDTSFHFTIPKKAAIYGISLSFYKKGIKRYGFHGSSHQYVSQKAAKILNRPLSQLKLITCHLGNGCSISAIKNGKSIDTSMGFTPLEGVLMGSRPGDIDAGILIYLMKKFNKKELNELLNYKSGLLGISGVSNDVRDLIKSKNPNAKLALDVFVYRIVKYIGSYIAALNGVDAIVFTAGIGEHAYYLRKKILKNFEFLGLKLDDKKNNKNSQIIAKSNSKIKVFVIKTDEAEIMAREIRKFI